MAYTIVARNKRLPGHTIVGCSKQTTYKGNQLIVISKEIQIKHSPIINTECIYDYYFKIRFIVWIESSLFQLCRIRDISHNFSAVIVLHHLPEWWQEIIIQQRRELLYRRRNHSMLSMLCHSRLHLWLNLYFSGTSVSTVRQRLVFSFRNYCTVSKDQTKSSSWSSWRHLATLGDTEWNSTSSI